jgi:hypothetical protein
MRKVVHQFSSFKQASEADRRYYRQLTPEERLDILLDLIATYRNEQDEAATEFKRVYRVIRLGER